MAAPALYNRTATDKATYCTGKALCLVLYRLFSPLQNCFPLLLSILFCSQPSWVKVSLYWIVWALCSVQETNQLLRNSPSNHQHRSMGRVLWPSLSSSGSCCNSPLPTSPFFIASPYPLMLIYSNKCLCPALASGQGEQTGISLAPPCTFLPERCSPALCDAARCWAQSHRDVFSFFEAVCCRAAGKHHLCDQGSLRGQEDTKLFLLELSLVPLLAVTINEVYRHSPLGSGTSDPCTLPHLIVALLVLTPYAQRQLPVLSVNTKWRKLCLCLHLLGAGWLSTTLQMKHRDKISKGALASWGY